MKLSNFTKVHRFKDILRLCVCVVVSSVLILAGVALDTGPAQAHDPQSVSIYATQCQQFSYTLSATGTIYGTISWSMGGGPLPTGLSFDPSTATISGIPTGPLGTYATNFKCIDSANPPNHFVPFDIQIKVLPCALSFVSTPIPPSQENVPYYVALSATGGTGPYTWTATGLPAGLYLGPSSGIISGTPLAGSAGTYTVAVSVTDACCSTAHAGSFSLNVGYATYDFTVKIGPGLTSGTTKVLVDGSEEATLGGGQSETFTARQGRSHVVTVDQTVTSPGQSGTRFTVKGSADKTVSENNNLAYFDYAPAVLMEVNTNPSGVAQLPGSGWHAIDDVFNLSAPSPIDSNSQPGVQYRLKQWKLPDGSTSPNKDLAFTVSTPGTVTAVYDTYYLLTLSSDYPPVTETSWYLKGSAATYDLSLQEAPMMGFWGFLGGKLRPINDSGTQLMNAPFTQKINWSKDYTIPIIIIVIALLVIAAVCYFVYRHRGRPATGRRAAPRPAVRTVAKRTSSKTVLSKAKKPAVKKASSKRVSSKAKKRATR